jgi:transposase
MKPSLEQLYPYENDRKSAAKHFNVSEKTICRWMQSEGIYECKKNYGVKLNMQKAQEIRKKFEEGSKIKDIAKEYGVTFSAISRILHNINYPVIKETALVKVVYNPY